MLLENQEFKWIALGCVSVLGLGYYFRNLTSQQRQYQKKLNEFEQVYRQSMADKYKSLKDIMKNVDKKSHKIVCLQDLTPDYKPDTFKIYKRQKSIFADFPLQKPQAILQHQMGNEFFAYRGWTEQILCRLDDFNLSAKLLQEQRKDINLFKDINRLEAIVQSVTATLSPIVNIAIYGKLYYDDDRSFWTIEPFFLSGKLQLPQVVERFYKDKISLIVLTKFGILLGGLVLSYFSIIEPINRWLKKRKQPKPVEAQALSDMDFFKKKSRVTVKAQSLLNCEKCKTKNVQVLYQCGHLAICVDCHEKNASKQCALCKEVSTKFMRIFMA